MNQQNKMHYRFEIDGTLGSWIEDWFENLTVSHQDDMTIIEGEVSDQAHLHGILNKIRDLNLDLLSAKKSTLRK